MKRSDMALTLLLTLYVSECMNYLHNTLTHSRNLLQIYSFEWSHQPKQNKSESDHPLQ